MKRLFAALIMLMGTLFVFTPAPAQAVLTNCSPFDKTIWRVTHHGIDWIDVQTRFTYRRCTGPSGNPVADIWSADVTVYTFGVNLCNDTVNRLDKVNVDLRVTDLVGHSANPPALDIPCEADGFMTRTWGRGFWDDTTFRTDAGAQWFNDYHIHISFGDDKENTHTGGFPL